MRAALCSASLSAFIAGNLRVFGALVAHAGVIRRLSESLIEAFGDGFRSREMENNQIYVFFP